MNLEEHEARMHLTNAETIVIRERYASDRCDCTHMRVSHYSPGGSTGRCLTLGCRCQAYGWDGAGTPG